MIYVFSPPFQMLKNVVLQWGEMPTSVAFIGIGEIMGWGNKAIEIRNVETGHLDGVFMHKKAQRLKFLCERNDKVLSISILHRSSKYNNPCIQLLRCRSSSHRPKEVRLGKFISWSSTNLEWRIGNVQTVTKTRQDGANPTTA